MLLADGVYKLKAKKVQLVNKNNSIRERFRGQSNQYKRFKVRDTLQAQVSEYQDYLLLYFTAILRGSRLTLKQLANLNTRDQL